MDTITHSVDICVVGGGMAGITAALSAARHGARVLLMHERPVLGGNASSECRIHICGADIHNYKKHMRETGILEELRLENLRRNPNKNFSVWDTILYEKVRFEPNVTLLLNCSCLEVEMDGARISSVTGWQQTTQQYHQVAATIFADCSGDAILAPLSGADFRVGREARAEYGESIAPEEADACTMGMTCLFQAREYATPQPFTAPAWAEHFPTCAELPYGANGHKNWWTMGYWWIELGGVNDSIADTERLRDELLGLTLGVWDHIKNHCPECSERAANWALDWLQFLPAKRESRRYIGDHVLNQGDVTEGGNFPDLVAYGGWSMDDHHPTGFRAVGLGHPATIFHHVPPRYGIPYRSLYSRNIENLMFAGRDASCSHAAMSSTRVMGTGCSMGQAVGVAAALAVQQGITPRAVGTQIATVQQQLIADDCYLPGLLRERSALTLQAQLTATQGDPEPVRDGVNRQVGEDPHCWVAQLGDTLTYTFAAQYVSEAVLILDSAMAGNIAMSWHQRDDQMTQIPPPMPKCFRLEVDRGNGWELLHHATENYQRHIRIPIEESVQGVRYTLEETWGAAESRVYAFYLEECNP